MNLKKDRAKVAMSIIQFNHACGPATSVVVCPHCGSNQKANAPCLECAETDLRETINDNELVDEWIIASKLLVKAEREMLK